jgi:hypothetical protein
MGDKRHVYRQELDRTVSGGEVADVKEVSDIPKIAQSVSEPFLLWPM